MEEGRSINFVLNSLFFIHPTSHLKKLMTSQQWTRANPPFLVTQNLKHVYLTHWIWLWFLFLYNITEIKYYYHTHENTLFSFHFSENTPISNEDGSLPSDMRNIFSYRSETSLFFRVRSSARADFYRYCFVFVTCNSYYYLPRFQAN